MTLLMIRSQLVAPALSLVREAGGDAEALAQRFHLPPIIEFGAPLTISIANLRALLDAASDAIADPSFGLHMALRYRRGMYGLVEFTVRSGATIRDGLASIARYAPLWNEHVRFTHHEEAGRATITQAVHGSPNALGRHANEFFAAALVLQAREACGVAIAPERATFAHPRPEDTSELEATLGTRAIDFDADANAVVLGPAVLDLPLRGSDPPLLSLLEGQAKASLAARPAPNRLLEVVRQAVRKRMEREPTLDAIARALHMSSRTLQRQLALEGTAFQEIVDRVREETARHHVAHGTMTLSEISAALGYGQLSTFLRAFKRWTGTTPRGYRASLAQRAGTSAGK